MLRPVRPGGGRSGGRQRPATTADRVAGRSGVAGWRADHRRSIVLADPEHEQAAATLDRWRRKVAVWAESPSGPIPAGTSERLHSALDDDLDIPALLVALQEIEGKTDVAPGAKFETFVYADRVLGLDLAREVGKGGPGGSSRSAGAET